MQRPEPLLPAEEQRERGNRLFKAGNYKAARTAYSDSIVAAPTHLAYANRAMAALKLKDYSAAEVSRSVVEFTAERCCRSEVQVISACNLGFTCCSLLTEIAISIKTN